MTTPSTDATEGWGRPVDDESIRVMASAAPPKLPHPATGERYFAGPIPMGWASRAAALPGKAWHLACALWFEAVCNKRTPSVRPKARTLQEFGLTTRTTFYRALDQLEAAGLVDVQRRTGRLPLVTILNVRLGDLKQTDTRNGGDDR